MQCRDAQVCPHTGELGKWLEVGGKSIKYQFRLQVCEVPSCTIIQSFLQLVEAHQDVSHFEVHQNVPFNKLIWSMRTRSHHTPQRQQLQRAYWKPLCFIQNTLLNQLFQTTQYAYHIHLTSVIWIFLPWGTCGCEEYVG